MSASNEIISNMLQCGVFFWDASEEQTYVVSENFRDFLGLKSCTLTQKDLEKYVDKGFAEFMSPVKQTKQTKLVAPLHIDGDAVYVEFHRSARYTDAKGILHSAGTAFLVNSDVTLNEDDPKQDKARIAGNTVLGTLRSAGHGELSIYDHIANITRTFKPLFLSGAALSVWKRFDGDIFYCIAIEGPTHCEQDEWAFKQGTKVTSPFFSYACDHFGTKTIHDIRNQSADWMDDRSLLLKAGCLSIVETAIRTIDNGMPWGIVCIMSDTPHVWTDSEKQMARLLSDTMETLLAQFASNEQLRTQLMMTRLACETGGITIWRRDLVEKKRYVVAAYGNEQEVNYNLFIHNKDLGRYEEAVKKLLRPGAPVDTNTTTIRLRMRLDEDAEYRWFDVSARILSRDENGKPTAILSAACDVDEQVRRELDKKREDELRNSIYDKLPAGVAFCNAQGDVVYINETSIDLFGLRCKEDLYGVNIFNDPLTTEEQKIAIRTQDSFEIVINYDFQKLSDRKYFHTRRKDTVEIQIRISKLYNGDSLTGYMIVTIDSNRMIFQQKVLNFFRILLHDVAHFAKLGVCRFGKNVLVSDQWNINLGIPYDTKIATNLSEYTTIEPTDMELLLSEFNRMKRGTLTAFQRDVRVRKADGVHWLSMYFTKTGEGEDYSAISMDVTENKENQLMLVKARNKAEHTEMLKSHFLNNVSHELRTPLNAIIGFSELIVQRNPDPEMKRYSNIIKSNNEHLLRLVNSIMEMSQLQTGNKTLTREMVDVDTLWTHIYERQKTKASAEVQFVCAYDSEHRGISAFMDQVAVSQVMDNLLNNAFKFTMSGCVMMWLDISDNRISFHVSDTGCGIPPEQLDRIFDTFVKLDYFTVGTGLGLPISQSLAKQMGGRVNVESTLGKGSHFWLEIPLLKSRDELEQTLAHKTIIVLGKDFGDIEPSQTIVGGSNVIRCKSDTFTALWLEHKPHLTVIDARVCPDVATIFVKNTHLYGPEYKIVVFNDSLCGVSSDALREAGADDVIDMPTSRTTIDRIISKYTQEANSFNDHEPDNASKTETDSACNC